MTRAKPAPAATPYATTDRTVHVVHVIGTLDRGGAETLSLDICRAVPATEVRQTFITTGGREGSLAAEFRAAGASVLQCPIPPVASFPFRLWRCLRQLRPEVVVSHICLVSAVVLLVARAAGTPVRIARIWSETDFRPDTVARVAMRSLLRQVLRRVATDVVAVSDAALAFAGRSVGAAGCQILYNSVDSARIGGWDRSSARRRWNLPEDAGVIAYIGRADPVKNRPFLVDIHREVRTAQPTTRLLLVGPCGVDDVLSAHPQVRQDPSVILGGEPDEIGSVLAAADVFVLPSVSEGLPGVVLEALAAGVPVVATNLPCLREASRYVKGLTLLDLSDGPRRWADAVTRSAATAPAGRDEIRASFAESPFRLEHAAAQWRSLWRGAGT